MAVSFQTLPTDTRLSVPYGLALCLLGAIILQHTPVPTIPSYLVVLLTYVVIGLVFLSSADLTIEARQFYVVTFLLFALVAGFSTFLNVSAGATVRYLALLTFTTATLFLLPKVIPQWSFLFALSRLAAVLAVVGLLPYLGVPQQVGFVDLSLRGTGGIYWYDQFAPITSVFVNPNALGFFTFVGAVAAFGEWYRWRTNVAVVLFGTNVLGLAFTNYRTGWLAFTVALGAFVVYSIGGRKLLMIGVASGVVAVTVVVLMVVHVLPGPAFFTELSLNGRQPVWLAGLSSFQEHPWLGVGFGNTRNAIQVQTAGELTYGVHNSYLRMFMALGAGGGILYLLLYLSSLFGSIRRTDDYRSLTVSALLIGFLFIQLFNILSFVGIALHSVVIALTMGYYVTDYDSMYPRSSSRSVTTSESTSSTS